MSRGIVRGGTDICADCSKIDPPWASVNRGVLICNDCCSVHRSLGRHISQVKSLKKSVWSTTQLAMVHQLVGLGANNIWEYSLLDPSQNKHGRRKPNPHDPVYPTKADFIRAKYMFLAFVNKQKDAGSQVNCVDDLSQQLHSTVRTANIDISLRLLSLGAEPNFIHPEKGSSPVHVAASANQPLQLEILVVNGADPGAVDSNGKTPVDLALLEGHQEVARRLVECQYELTDRLSYYLCSRKPDHSTGQHFLIPAMADSSLDLSELAKAAKKKLQALPNGQFEELARDVFDEVDRRETENTWLQSQPRQTDGATVLTDRQSVLFLPVNPDFSATRNQGRQKLARFNAREFATLIIDVLNDVKRRQCPQLVTDASGVSIQGPLSCVRSRSLFTEEEPVYDCVASDDDYASITSDNLSMKDIPANQSNGQDVVSIHQLHCLQRESETRINQLQQVNRDLQQEVTLLQKMVSKLVQENERLRVSGESTGDEGDSQVVNSYFRHTQGAPQAGSQAGDVAGGDLPISRKGGASQDRPASVFEMRDPDRHDRWIKNSQKDASGGSERNIKATPTQVVVLPSLTPEALESPDSDYDNSEASESDPTAPDPTSQEAEEQLDNVSQGDPTGDITPTDLTPGPAPLEARCLTPVVEGGAVPYPTQEEVVKKTEVVTDKIKGLLGQVQEGRQERLSASAQGIYTAVNDMVQLFPQDTMADDRVESVLHKLTLSADKLRVRCQEVEAPFEAHSQTIIQCAFNIAQACKELVMSF